MKLYVLLKYYILIYANIDPCFIAVQCFNEEESAVIPFTAKKENGMNFIKIALSYIYLFIHCYSIFVKNNEFLLYVCRTKF